jgi:hypothetical protein
MTLGRLRLSVADARDLAEGALRGIGYHNDEARIIADHVIDAAMCGYEYSGLAKILRPLLWSGYSSTAAKNFRAAGSASIISIARWSCSIDCSPLTST